MSKQRGIHFDPRCLDAFTAQIDVIMRIQNMLPDVETTRTLSLSSADSGLRHERSG
jgi:hypothetical protein